MLRIPPCFTTGQGSAAEAKIHKSGGQDKIRIKYAAERLRKKRARQLPGASFYIENAYLVYFKSTVVLAGMVRVVPSSLHWG